MIFTHVHLAVPYRTVSFLLGAFESDLFQLVEPSWNFEPHLFLTNCVLALKPKFVLPLTGAVTLD